MDFKKLEAFIKVVDVGSISRAALSLHLTQSSLSQQVSSLEAGVGVQLLQRTKQGVFPTRAGRVFYRHAQQLLRGYDEALGETRERGDGPSGRVSVGLAPYSLAESLTVPLLRAVRARLPNVVLHVRENFGGQLSDAIATGQMDMGLLYTPIPLRAVHVEPLSVDELVVLAHRDRMLPDAVDFPDLVDVDLIVPTRQHSVRLAVDAGFQRHDAFPRIAGEVESLPSMLQAVSEDLAATIVPRGALPDLTASPQLRISELGDPPVQLRLAFCTSTNEPLTEQATAVERILRALLAGLPVRAAAS